MAKYLQQRDLILILREEGLSYKEIAERTDTNPEYARYVCSKANRAMQKQKENQSDGICRFCGKKLTYTPGAKRKEFCDDKCRSDYYSQQKMRKPYVRRCEHCGKEFVSYGYPKKRFCCRDCRTMAERKCKNDELVA